MKICSKCKIRQMESEYYMKDSITGRLHAQCKQCFKKHRATRYPEHYRKYKQAYQARAKVRRHRLREAQRANMLAYLSDKFCEICAENDIRVLEFDHINPNEKRFNISQALKLGYSWDDTVIEIAKCRILCANCHKKHTASQLNWYKA